MIIGYWLCGSVGVWWVICVGFFCVVLVVVGLVWFGFIVVSGVGCVDVVGGCVVGVDGYGWICVGNLVLVGD